MIKSSKVIYGATHISCRDSLIVTCVTLANQKFPSPAMMQSVLGAGDELCCGQGVRYLLCDILPLL